MGYSSELVLEAETLRHQLKLAAGRGPVAAVAFSADGKQVVAASQGCWAEGSGQSRPWPAVVTIWEVATGREIQAVPMQSSRHLTGMALQPGEGQVALASAPWPPAQGEEVYGEVALHDAATGRDRLILCGHKGCIDRLAFSPDGLRLATASEDGLVKVWEQTSGQELATIPAHEGGTTAVRFGSDGKHLVTGGRDGAVKLWVF
jgi:WD40 repeat protein